MINLSRRVFILGLPAISAAAASILSPHSTFAQAEAGTTQGQADQSKPLPPAAQFTIGRFTITALADGYADMPFAYFPGRSAQQVEEMANAMAMAKPGGIRFVFNQYLIDDGERLIL